MGGGNSAVPFSHPGFETSCSSPRKASSFLSPWLSFVFQGMLCHFLISSWPQKLGVWALLPLADPTGPHRHLNTPHTHHSWVCLSFFSYPIYLLDPSYCLGKMSLSANMVRKLTEPFLLPCVTELTLILVQDSGCVLAC